jgi:hypothetical protein
MSTLTNDQKQHFTKRINLDGVPCKMTVQLRFDDECGNGHNTFSITADIRGRRGFDIIDMGGCLHDEIREHFPELAHLIRWHLTSTDGPMHYLSNTTYLASDRDHWGLRVGEIRKITTRDGLHLWEPKVVDGLGNTHSVSGMGDVKALGRPKNDGDITYIARCRVGEGKTPDLEAARRAANWPEATLEQLQSKEALTARLGGLLAEFREAVESAGFAW